MLNKDLIIIGGGSAGMAAAIEAKKNGVDDILILEKDSVLGGILNQCIHNGFGLTEFKEAIPSTPPNSSITIAKCILAAIISLMSSSAALVSWT